MTVENSGDFKDVIGRAIERFHRTGQECFLQLWIDGEPEPPMPVSSFFRNRQGMYALEVEAMQLVRRAMTEGRFRLDGDKLLGPDGQPVLDGLTNDQRRRVAGGLQHPFYWAGIELLGTPW